MGLLKVEQKHVGLPMVECNAHVCASNEPYCCAHGSWHMKTTVGADVLRSGCTQNSKACADARSDYMHCVACGRLCAKEYSKGTRLRPRSHVHGCMELFLRCRCTHEPDTQIHLSGMQVHSNPLSLSCVALMQDMRWWALSDLRS